MTANKEVINGWREVIEGTSDKTSVQEENARLRKALEFYADKTHYGIWTDSSNNCPTADVLVDDGYRAREALNNGEALHGNSSR